MENIQLNDAKLPEFTREPIAVFVLHPGPVVSKSDGDIHFISAQQLAVLYRVDPRHSIEASRITGGLLRAESAGEVRLVHLHPRYDGNYTLPGA